MTPNENAMLDLAPRDGWVELPDQDDWPSSFQEGRGAQGQGDAMKLTEMDKHILTLALMALCGEEGITEGARDNVRHAAEAVGVYDEKLEVVISLREDA